MSVLENNVELLTLNTFGVSARAKHYGRFSTVAELRLLLESVRALALPLLCLGGGSNILLTKPFEGVVLKNEIKGLDILSETPDAVRVRVGAGVVWHDFVEESLRHEWAGLENLSLIPGTVGAAPIQNIGAYGVEVKDLIESVQVLEITTGDSFNLSADECQFGYRDSVFKREDKGKWIITSVVFRLKKQAEVKTHYGAIQAELLKMGVSAPNIRDVSQAVVTIRRSKLPDPQILGNAGSFFKNPVVSSSTVETLKKRFPKMVSYPDRPGFQKLAAGWLIEDCGLKGYREGTCGVHKDQALVLVNYGGATGQDILLLAQKVQKAVQDKFHILLEMEVNIL